jgi:hypothetical protein
LPLEQPLYAVAGRLGLRPRQKFAVASRSFAIDHAVILARITLRERALVDAGLGPSRFAFGGWAFEQVFHRRVIKLREVRALQFSLALRAAFLQQRAASPIVA